MADLSSVNRVSQAQYNEIIKNGSTTSGGTTYNYDANCMYQVVPNKRLLWYNTNPFSVMYAQDIRFSNKVSAADYKYLVFVLAATNGVNDGAFMVKCLNPIYSGAESIVANSKHMYLSFHNDSGMVFIREVTAIYSSYLSVSTGYYASSSASSTTASSSYCIPLEIWGTNDL